MENDLIAVLSRLADAMIEQAQAIDRLAASNEAIVEAILVGDPDIPSDTYLDGTPRG